MGKPGGLEEYAQLLEKGIHPFSTHIQKPKDVIRETALINKQKQPLTHLPLLTYNPTLPPNHGLYKVTLAHPSK